MSFDPARVSSVRLIMLQQLLQEYDGQLPFAVYLKSFFRKHRNFGSRDRAFYTAWSFAFFRIGKAIPLHEIRDRLQAAGYLLNIHDDIFREFLGENDRDAPSTEDVFQRFQHLKKQFPDFIPEAIFPFASELSDSLTAAEYAKSMLARPSVWIRMIRGRESLIKEQLREHHISFREDPILSQAIAVEQESKLDVLPVKAKGYIEIQDRSSQQAAEIIPAVSGEHWWDCCCGAGGKTLSLMDRIPRLKITASDIRLSILENFRTRTKKFQNQIFVKPADLTTPLPENFFNGKFDGIVADVPCSGSGTWGRTPENLVYFDEKNLAAFVNRQQNIVKNLLPFLKPGGTLVYITCSVFKCENEDNVHWISQNTLLKLQRSEYINGIINNSDSMYYAIFVLEN